VITAREHVETLLGQPARIFSTEEGSGPKIDIAEYEPTEGREHWTYLTWGMSNQEQFVPTSAPEWVARRVELLMYSSTQAPWSVNVLHSLACHPFINQSYFFWWHTIGMTTPLNADDDRQRGFLLLPPYFEEASFDEGKLDDCPLRFLMAIPITETERTLGLTQGGRALEDRLIATNTPVVYTPGRSCCG